MDRRYPSSSVHLANRSSIRHRSGAFSPNLGCSSRPRSESNASEKLLTVQVEDVDGKDTRPTILLVQRSKDLPSISRTPQLRSPFGNDSACGAASLRPPDIQEQEIRKSASSAGQDVEVITPFSPVPLTPRPQLSANQTSPHVSAQATNTAASRIFHLSTPAFIGKGDSIQSILPRWFSRREAPASDQDTEGYIRPQNTRADSGASVYSTQSSVCSGPSVSISTVNSRRPVLPTSISTTEKLTRKFPISGSLRRVPRIGADGSSARAGAMLEKSAGLGMERVDRWTCHKWCLMLSVCTVFVYGTAGLVCAVLTWYKTWDHADVMYVADFDVLILITVASIVLLVTFIIGITGTILNSRPILAVYALLLWPALLSLLAIGYTSYKRYAFALDRKLNFAWSQWYTPFGRLVIQNSLRCCGYYDALHEATSSKQCYARTLLPGCKGKLYRFERTNLATVWSAAFALVPVHIMNIFVALLCANHVTRTFGKGITPRQYRLSGADVRMDAEKIFGAFKRTGAVSRPEMTRAPSSGVFREDKEDLRPLVNEKAEANYPGALHPGTLG